MNGVKAIDFRGIISGRGIVNFDGTSKPQRELYNEAFSSKTFDTSQGKFTENFLLGKHVYAFNNETGKVDGKVIISSNCLRHNIFVEGMPNFTKVNRNSNENIARIFAHPAYLVRGWMETSEKIKDEKDVASKDTTKRKSPLMVADAVQKNKAIPFMSLHSNMGAKVNGEEANKTSLFSIETIGDIEYDFISYLNLEQLSFISFDSTLDSMAIHPDTRDIFIERLKETTKGEICITPDQVGKYIRPNQADPYPEEGILLTNEQIMYLVRYTLKQIAKLNIQKSGAFAKMISLEYNLISDPTKKSQMFNSSEFNSLSTVEDIDNLSFEVYSFYQKVGDFDSQIINNLKAK